MQNIDVVEYLPNIIKELRNGILLNTKNNDKINSMTIGWGQIGVTWGKTIFTAYIRHGRFTHEQIESSKEFTISIPTQRTPDIAKAIGYCGYRTGKNIDKLAECNLTTVRGISVDSPAIREIPLTLECKVIYQQEQNQNNIPKEIIETYYPADVSSDNPRANRDFHTVYYGEIVNAYIL